MTKAIHVGVDEFGGFADEVVFAKSPGRYGCNLRAGDAVDTPDGEAVIESVGTRIFTRSSGGSNYVNVFIRVDG